MAQLRSVCTAILLWVCAVSDGSAETDFSHWRWWFLASTTDSTAIELYNQIEHKYLQVSDLRVLREDLAPFYVKLAVSIGSESEAQIAGLLIRLFHYSAARPFRTAELVDKLSTNLANYLTEPSAAKLQYEVAVDLWVATDIGLRCVINADTYRNQQRTIDNKRTARIINARVREGSADNLIRNRFMVQSIDGVTKYLDFNGVVDSTLAFDLISALGEQLDTLDLLRQPDVTLPNKWHLLLRFHLAMKARLYNNNHEYWKREDATNAFALESSGKHTYAPMCFPEARLRAGVVVHQLDRASSTSFLGWALTSSRQNISAFVMALECLAPGYSRLLDQAALEALTKAQPVSLAFLSQTEVQSEITDSLTKVTKLYSDCFNVVYRGEIGSSNAPQSPACPLERALEDLMYDENYPLRRLILLRSAGRDNDAVKELALFVKSVNAYGHQHRMHHKLVEWALTTDVVALLDTAGRQGSYSIAAALNWQRLQNLVATTNPWSASYSQNQCKAQLITAIRALDTLLSSEQTLMRNVWSSILQLRGVATDASRRISGLTHDSTSSAWMTMSPLGRFAMKEILRIEERAEMASYLSGMKDFDVKALENIVNLSLLSNNCYRSTREKQMLSELSTVMPWKPKKGRMYIALDPYYEKESTNARKNSSGLVTKWHISLLSADTLIHNWNVGDSTVAFSLYHKVSGVGYGVNTATLLDSIILSLLDTHERRFGTSYNEVVFFPSGILFAYNFYLTASNNAGICDRYSVRIATRPSALTNNAVVPLVARFLTAGDNGLVNAVDECQDISDTLKAHGSDARMIAEPSNETVVSANATISDVFHISSHAVQPSIYALIAKDSSLREVLAAGDIGVMARRIWSPLIQYRSTTRDSGALFGDGYISPFEMELFGARFKNLVFLSTCQTATLTGDLWEPPDGIIRELFAQGARCVVMSPVSVPDKYAPVYSTKFYSYLLRNNEPHSVATQIVREGRRLGASVYSYGLYFPIYFETE